MRLYIAVWLAISADAVPSVPPTIDRSFSAASSADAISQTLAPVPDVWYSPHFVGSMNSSTPMDLFPLLNAPETAWPELASRSSWFKLKMKIIYPTSSTDAELSALIATLRTREMRVGIEIGGARWGRGSCNATTALNYAQREQKQVHRWIQLGGTIDSATTDHAMTWDIRNELKNPGCEPPVPMVDRIDVVAQVFASWRSFLGPKASLGFIESLGYWDIDGPDGTEFTNTSPQTLNNISGWIPRLDDFTSRLLATAKQYNPTPAVPLLDHYQIDYEMDGVEEDTCRYGASPGSAINYGRVLGAEAIMKAHGLQSAIIFGANPAGQSAYGPTPKKGCCLVACDPTFTPSHSAALRTLNFTRGYMQLPGRTSQHAILEQWQRFPNVTGPEAVADTGMWMCSKAAAIISATAA
jgi:hypothetical protein